MYDFRTKNTADAASTYSSVNYLDPELKMTETPANP
jgi:hypothetical protein